MEQGTRKYLGHGRHLINSNENAQKLQPQWPETHPSVMGLEASPGQDRLEEWEGEVACDPSFWAPGLDRIGVVSALILAKQPDV